MLRLIDNNGRLGICEAYLNYRHVEPTASLLVESATAVHRHAKQVAPEIFGDGFYFVVSSEPGSLIDRCAVYASIASLAVGLASTTPSQLARNLDEWRAKAVEFSDTLIEAVTSDDAKPGNNGHGDKSVILQRKSLAVGKIERIVEAARRVLRRPKSEDAKYELAKRVQGLLKDAATNDERSRLVEFLSQLPEVGEALVIALGPHYKEVLRDKPRREAMRYSASVDHAGLPRERPTEKRTTPVRLKPVVIRFST